MTDINSELAKATGQIAVDTVADGRRALAAIFGDAAAEFALLLGDNVKLWRFKNLLRIQDRVAEISRQRGLSQDQLKSLPLGESLRVANAASDEDQPEVQALWARLIANATSGAGFGIERAFIDLLKSLSPSEVILLDLLWKFQNIPEFGSSVEQYNKELLVIRDSDLAKTWQDIPESARHVAIQNLQRLRSIVPLAPREDPFLIKRAWVQTDFGTDRIETLNADGVERQFRAMHQYLREAIGGDSVYRPELGRVGQPEWQTYTLTSLGDALMRACTEYPADLPDR